MTYTEFRKAHPAQRNFMAYTSAQRANHAASHRLGYRQRASLGQFFYTHPMCGNRAFDSAGQATKHAYRIWRETNATAEIRA